ncbi:MAG: hypothetical protein ABEK50_17745 [bacterium]
MLTACKQSYFSKISVAVVALLFLSFGSQLMAPTNPAHAGLIGAVKDLGEDIYDEMPKDLFKPLKIDEDPEIYGPTRINAQLGNQGLSVALSEKGTITVFRYPRPSFFDQVKYHTTDRDKKPHWGADPNAGSFLGLVVETSSGKEVHWLRDWYSSQTYVDDISDVVRTTYTNYSLGLTVTVEDVVPINENVTAGRAGDAGSTSQNGLSGDAMIRDITVSKSSTSDVKNVKLVSFENFSLVVSKNPMVPTSDWAQEIQNTDQAQYDGQKDAVVHTKSGHDLAKGFKPTSVATVMAFDGNSSSHEVSGDRYIGNTSPDGAYDSLNENGQLSGRDSFQGQTTGALAKDLKFTNGEANARVILAAADNKNDAFDVLDEARSLSLDYARKEKREWFDKLTSEAPIPQTSNEDIVKLSKRSLMTLLLDYDPRSGGIVASIATQSPYAEDWPRDGAYFNYVLDHKLGLHEWVEKHNLWYTKRQAPWWDLVRPEGTFAMNYYTDGAVGGIIPWEIDEVAYVVWLYNDHYEATYDKEYLRDVWPSLKKAANFLHKYEEPCAWWEWGNCANLQKPASEDDHFKNTQTIWGAGTVYMAMDAAYEAAKTLGKDDLAAKYKNRREELDTAINRELWDSEKGTWGKKHPGMAEMAWPIQFRYTWNDKMENHLETAWNKIKGTFKQPEAGPENHRMLTADGEPMGLYETKTLLSGAKAWKYDSDKMDRVENGLKWVAERWATDDTHIMGEVWMVQDGEVVTTVSQPHAWEQALFYLAAVEAYPDYSYYYF